MMAPPRVQSETLYWAEAPPELSPRCVWWMERIQAGWKMNRRISIMGYHESAIYFGVFIYEYIHHLSPILQRNEPSRHEPLPI